MAATDRTRTNATPTRPHPAIERWQREHRYGSRSYGGHGTLTPDGVDRVDTAALARDLSAAVGGEVRFGAGDRAIYSHDSSNYRQPPIGVVVPRDTNDVVAELLGIGWLCQVGLAPGGRFEVAPAARGCGLVTTRREMMVGCAFSCCFSMVVPTGRSPRRGFLRPPGGSGMEWGGQPPRQRRPPGRAHGRPSDCGLA